MDPSVGKPCVVLDSEAAGRLDIDQSTLDQGNADQALSLLEDSEWWMLLINSPRPRQYCCDCKFKYLQFKLFLGIRLNFQRAVPSGRNRRRNRIYYQEDGLILTNRHVVSREDADYTVVMNDGKNMMQGVVPRHRE